MIVLAVVAVLASIALPSYAFYVARQRVSVGQSDLVSLAMNMETHLQNNTSYPVVTTTTAITQTALTGSGWAPVASSHFTYRISAVSQPGTTFSGSYTLTAVGSAAPVSGCTMTLTSANVRTLSGCPGGSISW